MRNLRIIFMGTPDFAAHTLKMLFDYDYDIVGVITAPDRPAGRGRKIQRSAVKQYAVSKGLKVFQPINLKDEGFISQLRSLNANLQVVVAFRMLPKVVWEMPLYGTFNLHASLLPNYRGAAPIHWAIINGEVKTGVTTFFIDDKIDTGAIIFQEEVEITPTETVGTLHDKLMIIGATLVLKTIENIAIGDVKSIPQEINTELKTARKIHRDHCKIDWAEDVNTVYNLIRGLNPFPGAWSILRKDTEEIPIKVYESTKEASSHAYDYGTVVCDGKQIKVAVKNGFIEIKEMQLPGKRKMSSISVLNGFEIPPNTKML